MSKAEDGEVVLPWLVRDGVIGKKEREPRYLGRRKENVPIGWNKVLFSIDWVWIKLFVWLLLQEPIRKPYKFQSQDQ